MKNKQLLLFLFLALSITFIWAEFQGLQQLMYLTKPLLMTVLSVYFYLSVKDRFDLFCRYILLALLFSIAGDTFLMFVENTGEQHFFILGLGSFLFTHIFYTLAFLNVSKNKAKGFIQKSPFWAIPFLFFLIGNTFFLWPDIPGGLQIPVAVYSTAIVCMALAALNLKGQISSTAFSFILAGALLFVFSDSMIALNKFKSHQINIPEPRLLIMIPYLLGQYFIVKGSLEKQAE